MNSDEWSRLLSEFLKNVPTILAGIVFAWMGYRLFEGAAEFAQVQAYDHPKVLFTELAAAWFFALSGAGIIWKGVWRWSSRTRTNQRDTSLQGNTGTNPRAEAQSASNTP